MTGARQRTVLVVAAVLMGAASVTVLGLDLVPETSGSEPVVAKPVEAPLVEVRPVELGDVSTYIEATVNLVAEHQVSVVAEAEGTVLSLDVDAGTRVERGDRLVALSARSQNLGLDKARVELDEARTKYERAAQLAQRGLVSPEEVETLATKRDLAQTAVGQAKHALVQTRVLAPMAGLVTQRKISEGTHVQPGDVLFEIIDPSVLLARLHVSERDALTLETGRVAEFTLEADPSVKFGGSIRRIGSVVDEKTGTVEIELEVRDAPPSVRSGSFVAVTLVRHSRSQVPVVSRDAIVRGSRGDAQVYVVAEDRVERREVRLGAEEKGLVEIVGGLEPGESVVVAGHGGLVDGEKVRILEKSDQLG